MNAIARIHVTYIIAILVSIIITLLTVKWSEIPGLANYLTFALTVSSLCLAILAIGYSIYSNSSFTSNISSLGNSNHSLLKTSSDLSLVTRDLSSKIEGLPKIIKNVGDRVDQTHSIVAEILKKRSIESIVDRPDSDEPIPETTLKSFLKHSSFSGLIILYASSLSYLKKTSFSLTDLFEGGIIESKYLQGYLVAAVAFGVLSYEEKKDIISVTSLNNYIIENIHSSLIRGLELISGDISNLHEELELQIEIVEAFFSEKDK